MSILVIFSFWDVLFGTFLCYLGLVSLVDRLQGEMKGRVGGMNDALFFTYLCYVLRI